jgi:flagellar hook protein FlgE
MSSFAIPLSGLEASSDALNVIANNLANLNTDGFKSQTLNFGDIFSQLQGVSGNGDPIQIGGGVQVGSTVSDFSNGTVDSTGIAANMALQGNGFFVVSNGGTTSYTRDGDFSVNSSGQIVDGSGDLLMGFQADSAGKIDTGGALSPISVNSSAAIAAQATTSFSTTTNLEAGSAAGTTFSTPLAVTDSLGETQNLTITYTAGATPNTWNYSITLPASATGATAPTTVSSGTMTFDSSGNLKSTTPAASAGNIIAGIKITGLADGASPMSLSWNLNSAAGTPVISQQDSASATSATDVNGYGSGTLTGFSVLPDGTVEGTYTNNQTLALGQVAVANFANPEGLTQASNGNFQATVASGSPVVGEAGAGGNGTITGGAVEQSNVDLSTQFSNLIVAQQSYEASAKALTTLDQISQATIQMIT